VRAGGEKVARGYFAEKTKEFDVKPKNAEPRPTKGEKKTHAIDEIYRD